jgi:hypothetical protein
MLLFCSECQNFYNIEMVLTHVTVGTISLLTCGIMNLILSSVYELKYAKLSGDNVVFVITCILIAIETVIIIFNRH